MPNEVLIKIKVKDETDYEPTLVKAREFAAKAKEILDETGNIKIEIDAEEAKVEIDEVAEKLHRLDNDDAKIHIKVDDDEAKAKIEEVKEEAKKASSSSGSSSGSSFGKSFVKSLQAIDFKADLLPVGLAVGAALLPLISGGIAGLVVGGLGLGGIVGGVWAAAQDPGVKSAFQELKGDLGDSLKIDAAPFVPVVIDGIQQTERAFKALDIAGIFRDLAPQVQPILTGVLDLLSSIGNSIRNVAANSGPVIQELGVDFRNLGRTLETAFNSLTDDGKNEAQALHDLFAVIDGSIAAVFGLVNAFTELYGVFHKMFELGLPGAFELIQDKSEKVTETVKGQAQSAIDAANANATLADSASAEADASAAQAKSITEVSDALKAATDPAFALVDAQKQVNTATDAYNKAVRESGSGSQKAKDANENLQKALIGYIAAAGKARDGTGKLTDEQKALLHTAGASDDTIKGLNNTLQSAYKSAKKLDGFDVDIYVTQHFKQTGKYISSSQIANPTQLYSGLSHGGVSAAANGSTSSGLTWVNEMGPELMNLPPGTSVRTHGDSVRDVAAAMGGGPTGANAPNVVVSFDKSGLTGLSAALVTTLRAEIRAGGGSVQQYLGVPGVAA